MRGLIRLRPVSWVRPHSTLMGLGIVLSAVVGFTGCGSATNDRLPGNSVAPVSTSPPKVSGRLSLSNDGMRFEPCTALTGDQLKTLGTDPSTWTDVSMSGHGPRGCRATSAPETLSLVVLDVRPDELYPPGVASYAESSDPGIGLWRFNHANACAVGVRSGDALVAAAISGASSSQTKNEDVSPLCNNATRVLEAVSSQIPPQPDTPQTRSHYSQESDLAYTQLIQAGELATTTVPGIDVALVDSSRRILPFSELSTLDPESPGLYRPAVLALSAQLKGAQ